jgi:hypothetical protein
MRVLDMAPLSDKGLKITSDAHGECNLIEQVTIDLPSIGSIAIIDSKHDYRCCLDGRSKQKLWMMPIRCTPANYRVNSMVLNGN